MLNPTEQTFRHVTMVLLPVSLVTKRELFAALFAGHRGTKGHVYLVRIVSLASVFTYTSELMMDKYNGWVSEPSRFIEVSI